MVYWFSGTGNSEWVARELARRTGDEAKQIFTAEQTVHEQGERVGIVFPVYAWAAPRAVMQFAKRLAVQKNAYCYIVCTCGEEAGEAAKGLEKYFPASAEWSVVMPNNYLLGFDVEPQEVARAKVHNANEQLQQIAQAVLAKRQEHQVTKGVLAGAKTALIGPLFDHFGRSDKPYYAQESCNGCGVCAKACPAQNIRLQNGRPVWLGHCMQCTACLNRCPQRAIQYGKGTKTKGRYFFTQELLK